MDIQEKAAATGVITFILANLWMLAAVATHVVVCIKDEVWGLLIGGAIFAPIGWVHGTGIWFGWWS